MSAHERPTPRRIVVVGGGLAAATAVTELRERGYDGALVLIAGEPHPPYERPPLSKGFLLGKDPIEKAFVHEPSWYVEHDVELCTGSPATALDVTARTVTTPDHDHAYDALLLATGSRARHLAMADDSGVPVAYLRTIEDAERLKQTFGPGKRIACIGAGWIGLEAAAAAREAGSDVTVFEVAAQPLLAVLGDEVARVFADLHRAHGVDLRLGVSVTPDELAGYDLVLVGVGAVPNAELAAEAGVDVDNGVLVDETLRTSDPHVWAVGDVANQLHPVLGRVRVEHWDNAIEQAKTAAGNMLGDATPYARQPYFFTDQYDLGMEYVGRGSADHDVVVRGDVEGRVFQAFWQRDGVVVAAMQVNDWDAGDVIKAAVDTGKLPEE